MGRHRRQTGRQGRRPFPGTCVCRGRGSQNYKELLGRCSAKACKNCPFQPEGSGVSGGLTKSTPTPSSRCPVSSAPPTAESPQCPSPPPSPASPQCRCPALGPALAARVLLPSQSRGAGRPDHTETGWAHANLLLGGKVVVRRTSLSGPEDAEETVVYSKGTKAPTHTSTHMCTREHEFAHTCLCVHRPPRNPHVLPLGGDGSGASGPPRWSSDTAGRESGSSAPLRSGDLL